MTKEEALKVIRHMAYLSAYVVENGVEAYEYIKQLLSQPSIPSDLDEAVEKNFETMEVLEHENIFEETHRKIFEAGAEWIVGQGEAFDGIVRDNGFVDFDEYGSCMMIPSNTSCFNNGDKVIVQIRKK